MRLGVWLAEKWALFVDMCSQGGIWSHDVLALAVEQETFMDGMDRFRKRAYQVENAITSRSPIEKDVGLLKEYRREIAQFQRRLRARKREVAGLLYRYKHFVKNLKEKLEENSKIYYL